VSDDLTERLAKLRTISRDMMPWLVLDDALADAIAALAAERQAREQAEQERDRLREALHQCDCGRRLLDDIDALSPQDGQP
jgi:hypothetical protein